MSHKRKVEMILKENAEELQDNEKKKNAVWTEEVVAKSLTWKKKLRDLFVNLTKQGTSKWNKDSRKELHFQKVPLFCVRWNRGRSIFA